MHPSNQQELYRLGNYNYGAVGAAAGYQLWQLLNAGSFVNIRNILNPNAGIITDPELVTPNTPWLSNPRVDRLTIQGYQDYMAGKIKGLANE